MLVFDHALNPRQGITTQSPSYQASTRPSTPRVKHLNPRQGITTVGMTEDPSIALIIRVKHLNPRQGITTERPGRFGLWAYYSV